MAKAERISSWEEDLYSILQSIMRISRWCENMLQRNLAFHQYTVISSKKLSLIRKYMFVSSTPSFWLLEKIFGLVDFTSKVRWASAIRVVCKHDLAMCILYSGSQHRTISTKYLRWNRGARWMNVLQAQNLDCLLPIHLGFEPAFHPLFCCRSTNNAISNECSAN